MRVAAIFPVGTSVGGCPDALSAILTTESAVDVYLVHGDRGAPDAVHPKDSVDQIRKSIDDPRINWAGCRELDPFDFLRTYEQIRAFIGEIAGKEYDRVYVGITGGTNPMSASLFQTAMAYLPTQVMPMYVKAKDGVWEKNFIASEIRDRATAEEVLATARSGQIRIAAGLAEHLPSNAAPWKFLRTSITALSQWDDFDYDQAGHALAHQACKSSEYAENSLLAPLAETVGRISKSAARISALVKEIRDEQNFESISHSQGWTQRVLESGALVVADALANANRRIIEHRFTDSVLRCYRAAECATQMRLLAIGIHPATDRIDFNCGLQRLQLEDAFDLKPIEGAVRNLASTRNKTYLEHGYVRVQQNDAHRCFQWSLVICAALLNTPNQRWRDFDMLF
ncbi:MAG: hypothetical protein JO307_19595 [Bryobacterales bacterium]|nr:hypothetical protein [Bryobacterales bacterium]MBV9399377.1 hypothetical protein [Bryobacterales bacterium]